MRRTQVIIVGAGPVGLLTALGLKKVLEYVADTDHHELSDPLKGVALGALVVGLVTYLVAHVVFKYLASRAVSTARLAAAAVLLAAWIPLQSVSALGQLAVALVVVAGSIGIEAYLHREQRREIRSSLA